MSFNPEQVGQFAIAVARAEQVLADCDVAVAQATQDRQDAVTALAAVRQQLTEAVRGHIDVVLAPTSVTTPVVALTAAPVVIQPTVQVSTVHVNKLQLQKPGIRRVGGTTTALSNTFGAANVRHQEDHRGERVQ